MRQFDYNRIFCPYYAADVTHRAGRTPTSSSTRRAMRLCRFQCSTATATIRPPTNNIFVSFRYCIHTWRKEAAQKHSNYRNECAFPQTRLQLFLVFFTNRKYALGVVNPLVWHFYMIHSSIIRATYPNQGCGGAEAFSLHSEKHPRLVAGPSQGRHTDT